MYHLISSEVLTLGLGLGFGFVLRIVSHFQNFLDIHFTFSEFWILAFVFIIVVLLIRIMVRGQDWILYQHDAMSEVIIKKSFLTKKKLGKIFRPDYFNFDIGKEMAAKLEYAGIFSVSHLVKADTKELSQKIGITEEVISKLIEKANKFMKD